MSDSWPGATGLAEDVRRYGKWMRDEAEKRIGHLYPKAKLNDGTEATVIAWIWARTVTCPNPACAGTMPLVRSFWISKKKGRERYVQPIPTAKGSALRSVGRREYLARVQSPATAPPASLCGTPVPLAYVRAEGQAGRIGAQLMAIAAEGTTPALSTCRRTTSTRRPPMSLAQTMCPTPRSRITPGT